MTFTNAKNKWTTLMSILHTLNNNHMEIPKHFDELESKHFANQVRFDLVTCAHYYNHRMATFHNLLKKDSSIFGDVDFYFVTKFQNRGSEHNHGLLCIKNGPTYGVDSNQTNKQFVNKYVTSNNSLFPSHLKNLQMHKHKQTYKKKN